MMPRATKDVLERAARSVAEHVYGVSSETGWQRLPAERREVCVAAAREVAYVLIAARLIDLPPRVAVE
jgi:hypothetical protein